MTAPRLIWLGEGVLALSLIPAGRGSEQAALTDLGLEHLTGGALPDGGDWGLWRLPGDFPQERLTEVGWRFSHAEPYSARARAVLGGGRA